jgi:spore coat polysaccharide biosynthesis protein SpsF
MKIGFFITARLKSSRLKHKILLDLNGKSVIDRVIERCKIVKDIDGVVLCTSTNPQDSILYENAMKNGIQFYPGDEDDVLKRLENAALYYGYDAFLSITADNPLFSVRSAEVILDQFRYDYPDFIFTRGLPIGCNVTGIKTKALSVANVMKENTDTEIWGPFVKRSDFFSVTDIVFENSLYNEKKRLTIDYPEDYKLFLKLYANYDTKAIPVTEEVLYYLHTHQYLWDIINERYQKFPTSEEIDRIRKTFDINKSKGLNYAHSIGFRVKSSEKIIYV